MTNPTTSETTATTMTNPTTSETTGINNNPTTLETSTTVNNENINATSDETSTPSNPDDSTTTTTLKRRRKRKHYHIPISMVLRPHSSPSYSFLDSLSLSLPRRRRRLPHLPPPSQPPQPPPPPLDLDSLIAVSVGFPLDSLTEQEIDASVVPTLGGPHQSDYITVRNHILAKWRSNVSDRVSREDVAETTRPELRYVVDAAFEFLVDYGFINFGPSVDRINDGCHNGNDNVNVVVIGAGLAGLCASRQLRAMGFKVVVIEGRGRPGGRVRTRKMSEGGVVGAADLGGSVLTGINGNPLGVLARQLGFPLHKVRDVCPLYLPDGKAVDGEVDSRVEAAFNKLLDRVCKLRQAMMEEMKCVDVSLGTALEAFRKVFNVGDGEDPQEKMLLNWHLANLEYANASLLSNLSMAFWDQDDPYEMGGDHCFIPGGNERFIRALAEDLPIFYNRTVESVRYGDDGVLVYAGEQEFRADMVLCTVPLGVLKRGDIEFVPPLPRKKRDAIDRLGFGLLNKVAMLFPYNFWGRDIDTFGHLSEDPSKRGEFFLFYSYSSVSGGPLLVALVAGEAAIDFENLSPVDSVERVMDTLRGIFHPKGVDVPDPIQAVCTRWGQDRFTYGSYSYVAIGASGDDYDILAESVGNGRVFFAGEATNRQYPATMHGAFLSGMREAANILKAAKRRSSISANKADNVISENKNIQDLDELFLKPDLQFGNFSVLFDPRSDDSESHSLLRVEFRGGILETDALCLYGLLPRRQAFELSKVDSNADRLRMFHGKLGLPLVGRKGLPSAAESLIAAVREKTCTL